MSETLHASGAPTYRPPRCRCKVCRRRKTACDRARPKCGICTKAGLACEYAEKERHAPGLRAGYVQSLERRIGRLPPLACVLSPVR